MIINKNTVIRYTVALNTILPKRQNLILQRMEYYYRITTIKLFLVRLGDTTTLVHDPETHNDETPLQMLAHKNEDLDVVLEHEAVYVRVTLIYTNNLVT